MLLTLVRHAEADDAEPKRYIGGKTDLPLTAAGGEQARRLGVRLHGERFTHYLSSPMQRAQATIRAVANGAAVQTVEALREIDFGAYEGVSWGEIEQSFPDAWRPMEEVTVPFPGGESVLQLTARVKHFAETLATYPAESHLLIVAHGGSLRVLVCLLIGLDPGKWWNLAWANTGVSRISLTDGSATLLWHNDTRHLD